MGDIKLNYEAYTKLLDETLEEGKRKGLILAIDTLRNRDFKKMFDLNALEAEICAEALFTYKDKLLDE